MTNSEKIKAANQLVAALITNDWNQLKQLATESAVIEKMQQLSAKGFSIQSSETLYSLNGVAVSLHLQSGESESLPGEYLVSVLIFQDGKISAINNYFSNIPVSESVDAENLKIGDQFLTALKSRNWSLMRSVLADDASWTLPGTSLLSDKAAGAEAIINRAKQLRNFGVAVQLNNMLAGEQGVTLSLHNTAMRGTLLLDEQVAIVCDITNGKISGITTHLHDVEGINAFFIDGIL